MGGGSLLGFVAQTVRRLEDSVSTGFRDVQQQLTEMPRLYVPRLEIDRRFDDVTIDAGREQADRERCDRELAEQIAELRRRAEADAAERQRKEEALAAERHTARRQRIALVASSALALVGTATGVVLHFT